MKEIADTISIEEKADLTVPVVFIFVFRVVQFCVQNYDFYLIYAKKIALKSDFVVFALIQPPLKKKRRGLKGGRHLLKVIKNMIKTVVCTFF